MRHAVVIAALATCVACGSSGTSKLPEGESCTPQTDGTSTECASNLCIALDTGNGVCSSSCAKNPVCPTGFSCQEAGQFGLVCLRPAGCNSDSECPAGHICDTTTQTCYIKVVRELCDPCTANPQCPAGGVCFTAQGSGEEFCTQPCSAGTCPAGYSCQTLPTGDAGSQCVPVTGSCNYGLGLCAPCQGDNQCGTFNDLCVRNVVSGEQFCGTQCAPDAGNCPLGFTCTDLKLDTSGDGPFQCVPNSNTCVGYCDSAEEDIQVQQCGLGNTCDVASLQCEPAVDGRECAPCQTNDDCNKPDNPGNECIVNNAPNSPYLNQTFCSEPCPVDGGQAQCLSNLGPGFTCVVIADQGFCVPDRGTCSAGLGQLGDNCSADGPNDCVTGVCIEAGLGSICSAECTADSQCGNSRYQCCNLNPTGATDGGRVLTYDCGNTGRNDAGNGPSGSSGICAPQGGAFGDDCSPGHPPCSTGACLDLGTDNLCTQVCPDGVCPTNFECEQALDTADDGGLMVCFPEGGGVVGSDCTFGPAACASGLCIKKDTGNICTKACKVPSDCPQDYACAQQQTVIGETGMQTVCIPDTLE